MRSSCGGGKSGGGKSGKSIKRARRARGGGGGKTPRRPTAAHNSRASKTPRRSARPATARSSRVSEANGPSFPYDALTARMTPNPEVIAEWMAAHGLATRHYGITDDLRIILESTGGVIPDELLLKHNPYFSRRGT